MPIRFASARTKKSVRMTGAAVRSLSPIPANDNGETPRRNVVNAALRHFAEYGIAAAQHAREQAIIAGRAGDRPTFEWWLDICRALDCRMARQIDTAEKAKFR